MNSSTRTLLPLAAGVAIAIPMVALAGTRGTAVAWLALAVLAFGAAASIGLDRVAHRRRLSIVTRDLRQLDEIVRRIPSLVSVQDAAGHFVSVNPALVHHYGAGEELRMLGNLPRSDSLHGVDPVFEQVLRTATPVDVVRESHDRNGRVSTFNSSFVPIELPDGQSGVLHVATDITDLRAMHQSLSEALTRALSDFIPMCAGCRQVRVDPVDAETENDPAATRWSPLEAYVSERTAARFSHTFCPDCAMRLYGMDLLGDLGPGTPDRGEGDDA